MKKVISFVPTLVLFACGGAPGAVGEYQSPTSLEEAEARLGAIEATLAANPDDAQALADRETLRGDMEALNGWVAEVEIAEQHSVVFYDAGTSISVLERRPAGAASALAGVDPSEIGAVETYEYLRPGEPVPRALIDAEQAALQAALASPDVAPTEDAFGSDADAASAPPLAESGGTIPKLTASDGKYFRDNYCWPDVSNSFEMCLPNHGGGAWVQGYYRHSHVYLAPFSGNRVSLRRIFNGSLQSSYAVYPDEVVYYWQSGPPTCKRKWGILACVTTSTKRGTHRWEVTDASGDGFHFASKMND